MGEKTRIALALAERLKERPAQLFRTDLGEDWRFEWAYKVKNSDSASRRTLAAVYARVSTTNAGQDPTMQTRELVEYCQRRGWEVFDLYVDNGVSGKKDARPQL